MSKLKISDKAVEFCLPDNNEKQICLKDFKDKWVVIYFYPKDNTPGCTIEAVDFSERIEDFSQRNTVIIGISPDSAKSHCKFIDKFSLQVILLSDADHQVLEKFDAWVLKKMFGREYYGVKRSTFLINPNGEIAFIWSKVKARGHVQNVWEKLVELQK